MRKWMLNGIAALAAVAALGGCQTSSQRANEAAQQSTYQPVTYQNAAVQGVPLVVLPGEIRSANATFAQKIGSTNIADFAEIELSKANFQVLERTNLAELEREISIAYNNGDPNAARKLFQVGAYRAAQYVTRFDIIKAEPAATASQGFDGRPAGSILGAVIPGMGGAVAGTATGSVQSRENAEVWIVGLRYTIFDANTGRQVATNYIEDTMESGAQATSVVGVSQGASQRQSLDLLAQRLVQKAVQEIDANYKGV